MEFSRENGLKTMITPKNFHYNHMSCSRYNMMLGGSR
jgi:hypothetical protein